jgi:hypothetical protein
VIRCPEHPKNDASYLTINLLDQGAYFFFYGRRPFSVKDYRTQREEYLKIANEAGFVRTVGIMPLEEPMKNSTLRNYKMPFTAEKVISATFIPLSANNKYKAYFVFFIKKGCCVKQFTYHLSIMKCATKMKNESVEKSLFGITGRKTEQQDLLQHSSENTQRISINSCKWEEVTEFVNSDDYLFL